MLRMLSFEFRMHHTSQALKPQVEGGWRAGRETLKLLDPDPVIQTSVKPVSEQDRLEYERASQTIS